MNKDSINRREALKRIAKAAFGIAAFSVLPATELLGQNYYYKYYNYYNGGYGKGDYTKYYNYYMTISH